MIDVIVLCAGQSSRFPNTRPKWLLTHPNRKPLFARAKEGLVELPGVRHHYHLVVLSEHLERFGITMKELTAFGFDKVVAFDQATSSQAESADLALKAINPRGAVFFKDCDSYFQTTLGEECSVVTSRISKHAPLNLSAKCFVQSDNTSRITNIVEKCIVSNEFAVGGYGFESRECFENAFASIPKDARGEIFMSHVVMAAMLQGKVFFSKEANDYEDYGTPEAFTHEYVKYKTLFIDIDGCLLESRGPIGDKRWGTGNDLGAIRDLHRLDATGRYHIVLTTARPEELRFVTVQELEQLQVPYHQLVMGLPHAQRVLINDRRHGQPETALAVEVERDTPGLARFLATLE